jgi:NAD(P)H-flavin reductase
MNQSEHQAALLPTPQIYTMPIDSNPATTSFSLSFWLFLFFCCSSLFATTITLNNNNIKESKISSTTDKNSKIINDNNDMTKESSPPSWAQGVPTQLVRKVNIIPESDQHLPVYTLTFAIPDASHQHFVGPAVHHSKVRLDMGDVVKMVIPGYKPKSYSISELRDTEFDVTLKVYPNGRASGFLDRLEIGHVIGSFGKHAARTRNAGSYAGMIVFGVGITEGYPVAKAELEKGTPKVKLLWASRTPADTFWQDKLQQLQKDYPERFEMVYLYSREKVEGCLHGRVSPELLKDVFSDVSDPNEARFLSVGTKAMMKDVDGMLEQIGYPMPQHHLLPKNA